MRVLQRLCWFVFGHVLVAEGFIKMDGRFIPVGHCSLCGFRP